MARSPQEAAMRTVPAESPAPAPALAAPPAATVPEKPPAAPPAISYVDGQLRIDALDATLVDVLAKVAAVTGVKIDSTAAASAGRMPIVKLGPGPARQVLATLLSDSSLDYLILASDSDPDKIQSVLIMKREKGSSRRDAARRPSRSPYVRNAEPPPEEAAPETPAEAPAPEAAFVPEPPPPEAPSTSVPMGGTGESGSQPGMLNGLRVAPQSVPAMDPQSINQQLQQMYQQRMQIVQQERQAAQPVVPANPAGK
jgi:hypothetical protein